MVDDPDDCTPKLKCACLPLASGFHVAFPPSHVNPSAAPMISRGAVGGGLVAVGLDPGNFGFEQGDPFSQFTLRIGIKVFLRQQAGGISTHARQIIVHLGASFGRRALAVNRSSG